MLYEKTTHSVIILAFSLLLNPPLNAQYCTSKSNAPWELWIQNVQFNTINYMSDKFKDYHSLGYSDFTTINTTIKKGMTYELTTTVGVSWSGILPNAYCRTWIDWNRNDRFEDSELVFQNTNVNPFISAVRVPLTAAVGATRMRIAVKSGSFSTPCDTFGMGEVEDYTLTVVEPIQTGEQSCNTPIGNGTVLCFDNSNTNAISIYLAEGNTITQKTIDKTGRQLSSTAIGNLVKDSVFVVNNQVIKKLANGTIAFTKNIPPPLLNRFPSINTALEMSDGTYILAGYQKHFDPIFPPNNSDSLVLVVTDANLTYQNSFIEARGGGPYTPPQDSVVQLIPYGTNQFVVAYYSGFSQLITWHSLNFSSFQKDNRGNLNRLNTGSYGYELKGKPILTPICGNHLIVQSDVSTYSQKSSFRGNGSAIFNLDSMRPLTSKTIGDGNTDFFGDYKTYSYVFNPNLAINKYTLLANYSGNDSRIGINTFQYLDINFYDNQGVLSFKKTVPFVAFDHIIRTGDTTCLMVVNSNGQTSIVNPDCGAATTNNSSDIALSLTSTPSVYRQFSNQNFRISAKNTGNQAFTNVKIDFPYPIKTVNGGVETASIGTWQEWCSGGTQCFTWTIPSLAANETATLDVPLYVLDAVSPITATTHLLSSNPVDNTAANNTASVIINSANAALIQPLMQRKSRTLIPTIVQKLNPTITNDYIVVELESSIQKQITVQIINGLGSVVLQELKTIEKGDNAFYFDINHLPNGLYFMQTNIGNVPMKFVKF